MTPIDAFIVDFQTRCSDVALSQLDVAIGAVSFVDFLLWTIIGFATWALTSEHYQLKAAEKDQRFMDAWTEKTQRFHERLQEERSKRSEPKS